MSATRMVVYAKDIQRISGKSDRYARKILRAIRKRLGKEKHQPVSVKEFCEYMKLPETDVIKYLSA
jgi:hypothetical protein